MEEELIGVKNAALSFILEAEDLKNLEETKLQFLGKSGKLTLIIKDITKVPSEKRKEVGMLANEIKQTIEQAISEQAELLSRKKKTKLLEKIDVTNPGIKPLLGHLHLVTQAIEEIADIFGKIGFKRVRYPEIDWDYYAFEALNFPKNHPARDDWETFFIKGNDDLKKGRQVLIPHTSSGQIREMEQTVAKREEFARKRSESGVDNGIHIKMLNIAKCYRRQSDISHTPMFHQFEGLVVDENISIVDLKGTLDYFVKSYFGKDRKSRIRPYHFQFTEPSLEVDVTCGVCLGNGCKLCKGGWLEMGGAGMVHPNVLEACGINSNKYTGFAFGWGIERVLMMKQGLEIDDLRLLYSNRLEFLEQF